MNVALAWPTIPVKRTHYTDSNCHCSEHESWIMYVVNNYSKTPILYSCILHLPWFYALFI